jgi:hypothetical protein
MDDVAKQQIAIERKKVEFEREQSTAQINLEKEKLTTQNSLENEKLAVQSDLDYQKLAFERYKARLDYRKFVLASVFVALAVAAIPPLFQLATAVLESTKSDADRLAKQQSFRDDYNKDFINDALNQDIELRIRFAQYLANVASEPYKQDWVKYHRELVTARDAIRAEIDKMEAKWRTLSGAKDRDEVEIARLERNLDWAYKEVGYVPKNRSAVANPRVPEPAVGPVALAPTPTPTLQVQRLSDSTYVLTAPYVWTPKSDQGRKYEPIVVPAGFVTTLDVTPKIFWSILPPSGDTAAATVLLNFLYWDQTKDRDVADDIFRIALEESGVSTTTARAMYLSLRQFGQAAWNESAKNKAQGEKRILKEIPTGPVSWEDLKKRSDLFQ